MDILGFILAVFDFLKLLIPLSVIGFVVYKIFSPLRKKLAEKYDLSWIKSALIINFLAIFISIMIFYLIFMFIGGSNAPIRDPELEYSLAENAILVGASAIRAAISALILSLILIFFEMTASLVMEYAQSKSKRSKTKNSGELSFFSQFAGILVSSAIFLLLLLFIFSWTLMGFFVFIFYGGVAELPLLMISM